MRFGYWHPAAAVSRSTRAWLFGVEADDPLSLAAVTLTQLLIGCAAAFVPARRVSRLDPVRAQRHE